MFGMAVLSTILPRTGLPIAAPIYRALGPCIHFLIKDIIGTIGQDKISQLHGFLR